MARRRVDRTADPGASAKAYIEGVQKGKLVVGRYVELAVERHLRDLKDARKRGLWFDESAGRRILEFFPMLRLWKGRNFAGQRFIPSPWQAFITWSVFGWKKSSSGLRRFDQAYVEVAKKNGKSAFAGGIGNYLVLADGEPGADVYSAATKLDQARIVHRDAIEMLLRSPELGDLVGIFKDNINVPETSSKYIPLGADHTTMDGLNPHGAIIDEVHAHKNRGVVDQLETAMQSRVQPLMLMITTAGFDRHSICWEKRQYGVSVLEGTFTGEDADSFFAYVACLDEGDDWRDSEVWIKANPNLGVSVDKAKLAKKAAQAARSPAFENAFRRFHCNEWTEQEERAIPMVAWDASGLEEGVDPKSLPEPEPPEFEDFRGRIAYAGGDLATTIDIAAVVYVLPVASEQDEAEEGDEDDDEEDAEERPGELVELLCRFWIPAENMKARVERDKVPYDVWVRQGWLQTTPGNTIDYAFIRKQVLDDATVLEVRELAIDPHNAIQLAGELADEGLTVVPHNQGMLSMNAPTKDFIRRVLAGRIQHFRNPVLRWMVGNLVVKQDEAGNLKPDKKRSPEKIDGVVAAVMAVGRAALGGGSARSVYETETL